MTGRLRRIGTALAVVALLFGIGYTAYVGYEASRQAVNVDEHRSRDCRTPDVILGWSYEAINYPIEDDAALRRENPDLRNCADQGVKAGGEVVTSDGVHIAGWYIPAADASGPEGPTIVLVHGYAGDKSGILHYASALHQRYNLVAFDQRNGGRSSGTQTTLGVLEKNDVRAIVDWVERTKKPAHLALFGNSMGSAAAITEARHDPRVEALALDSMHTRIRLSVRAAPHGCGSPRVSGNLGHVRRDLAAHRRLVRFGRSRRRAGGHGNTTDHADARDR